MADVKLKEEQELWGPAEVDNSVVRELKEEVVCGGVQNYGEAAPTSVHVKEEPEELDVSKCPFVRVIVKSEDEEEESSVRETVKEEDRDGENSSDTDDSGDWAPSAERPTPQTPTGQLQEPAHGDSVSGDGGSDKQQANMEKSPYRCSVCPKEFTYKSGLMIHMRSHTDERPFKCSICSKCFKSKGHLKIHIGVHTGEKPFRCTICAKEYAYISDLRKHIRTHMDNTSRCSLCKLYFEQSEFREKKKGIRKVITKETCTKCSSRVQKSNKFCPIRPKPAQTQSNPPQAPLVPGPVLFMWS